MTKFTRLDFERWLRANGAEPLGAKLHEFMRFRAHGFLCIVYEPNKRGRQSCNCSLARQALDAWRSPKPISLDLSNPAEPEDDVVDRKAIIRGLCAVAERAKAGETLDIPHEAAALGIAPERLIRSLRAQRAPVSERAS